MRMRRTSCIRAQSTLARQQPRHSTDPLMLIFLEHLAIQFGLVQDQHGVDVCEWELVVEQGCLTPFEFEFLLANTFNLNTLDVEMEFDLREIHRHVHERHRCRANTLGAKQRSSLNWTTSRSDRAVTCYGNGIQTHGLDAPQDLHVFTVAVSSSFNQLLVVDGENAGKRLVEPRPERPRARLGRGRNSPRQG